MVPIYDSDVAEERWAKAGWHQYELWEKVEIRLRRNKRLWIAGTVLVFLGISSIPVVIEQRPKWMTLSASRALAQRIGKMKRDAGIRHSAYRIRFPEPAVLRYVVERVDTCDAAKAASSQPDSGTTSGTTDETLVGDWDMSRMALLTPAMGLEAGIPGLVTSFCYDPLKGGDTFRSGADVAGFGFIPVEDQVSRRYDRVSVLLLTGLLAEATFE